MHNCFYIYISETTTGLDKVLAFKRKNELAQILNISYDVERQNLRSLSWLMRTKQVFVTFDIPPSSDRMFSGSFSMSLVSTSVSTASMVPLSIATSNASTAKTSSIRLSFNFIFDIEQV